MMKKARHGKQWPTPTGAFLPVLQSGSGPVDHENGGGGFERRCLTPLERVFTDRDRACLAQIHHKG